MTINDYELLVTVDDEEIAINGYQITIDYLRVVAWMETVCYHSAVVVLGIMDNALCEVSALILAILWLSLLASANRGYI